MRATTKLLTSAALALALAATGCSTKSDNKSSPGGDSTSPAKHPKIALLLPESKTTRYEQFDKPLFEAKMTALCAECELLYSNADQDPAKQQSQAEAALTNGANVLVLDAVDDKAAVSIVNQAQQRGVPVIAYDRLISDAPIAFYVSFDNVKVGEMQAQALLDAISERGGDISSGQIVMLNGSPTDPSAGDYKKGAHNVFDGKATIGREYDTPDWSPDKAQQEMEQAITALGKDKILGVYSANDGMASGAIAAMRGASMNPMAPITGQDAEIAAVQSILTGDQYMTIYLAIRDKAEKSAELAVALAQGEKPTAPTTVNNGAGDVPSFLLDPIAVTKDKIKDTILKDGFYTVEDICTAEYADACKAAGLS